MQVLYSDFVSLIDAGKVSAARLEVATCKMYFDVRAPDNISPGVTALSSPASPAASSAGVSPPAAERSAAAASKVPPTSSAPAPSPASQAVSSTSGTAAEVVSVNARPRMVKSFFVKLAEKTDPFLVPYIVKAGIDFGIVKAGVTASLTQVFMTALSLWLPLIPLFFIAQHILEARSGSR
jgi:hypothetical protein